jgi:hypothetical protein
LVARSLRGFNLGCFSEIKNLCMSLAMQFSRRRKNPDSIPCLVGGRLEVPSPSGWTAGG